MVNSLLSDSLNALFPHACRLCDLPSQRDIPLCSGCQCDLPANLHCCSRCALPLPVQSVVANRICGDCLHRPPAYDGVVAPWLYGEYIAFLVQCWKYHHEKRLTPLLANLWSNQLPKLPAVDVLIPVPLHWRRQWHRGFNQAELLARGLTRGVDELGDHRVATNILRRHKITAEQSELSARARAANLRGAFTVRRPCDNLRVAVVDDVFTTGATASAVAIALKEAGASEVYIWCLARTPSPGA